MKTVLDESVQQLAKTSGPNWWLILLVVLAIILIIAAIAYFAKKKPQAEKA